MNNKLLILSMSCNREDYIFEEKVIRNTWGKPIINCEYENIELCFFRGGKITEYDEENHVLTVDEQDDLSSTYKKNLKAIKYFLVNSDFDWVLITNTSTVMNVPLINKFINSEIINEEYYYGSSLCFPLLNTPFFRGDFMLLSRKTVENLEYGQKDFANDTAIFRHLLTKDNDYSLFLSKLRQVKSCVDFKRINLNGIGSNFMFRVKTYERKNPDTIPITSVGVFNFMNADKNEYDLNTLVYPPKYVEANVGIFKIEKIKEFDKI